MTGATIIPKDTILIRMQSDRMSDTIEEINSAILEAADEGKCGVTITYNAQLLEVHRNIHVLEELLRNAGYYVRIGSNHHFMELKLIIRW